MAGAGARRGVDGLTVLQTVCCRYLPFSGARKMAVKTAVLAKKLVGFDVLRRPRDGSFLGSFDPPSCSLKRTAKLKATCRLFSMILRE